MRVETNAGNVISQGFELEDNTSEMLKFNVLEKPLLGFWALANDSSIQSLGPVLVNILQDGCKSLIVPYQEPEPDAKALWTAVGIALGVVLCLITCVVSLACFFVIRRRRNSDKK